MYINTVYTRTHNLYAQKNENLTFIHLYIRPCMHAYIHIYIDTYIDANEQACIMIHTYVMCGSGRYYIVYKNCQWKVEVAVLEEVWQQGRESEMMSNERKGLESTMVDDLNPALPQGP